MSKKRPQLKIILKTLKQCSESESMTGSYFMEPDTIVIIQDHPIVRMGLPATFCHEYAHYVLFHNWPKGLLGRLLRIHAFEEIYVIFWLQGRVMRR